MIAVLGATGQLGTAFVDLLGGDALPVARDQLDLSDPSSIPDWVNCRQPEVIVNCAGYTAVDAAETDKELARAVNSVAVGELARASRETGSRLVTFSTDYVFDGTKAGPYTESDEPNPLSVYGQSKLEGERLALEANPEVLIIRTSWVLSGTHPNFAATMLRLLRQGEVEVVDDQRGRPTIARDLATTTLQCLDRGVDGILHLTNRGETTWFGLAREIATLAGLDPLRVQPTTTQESSRPAPRPANSALESERLARLRVDPLPQYRESLPEVVSALVDRGY